jgi:glycosyltransferase involved in cell wall biosynthesis
MGMPCISNDCVPGGAKELIQDGENGLLSILDNGEDLAKKMAVYANDPAFAARMGEKAAVLKQTHSSSYIYSQWIDYIGEIMTK